MMAAKAELTAKVAAAKAFALSKAEKVDLTSAKKALAPVLVKAEAAKAELTAKVAAVKAFALAKAEKAGLASKVAAAQAFALEKAEKAGLTSKVTLVMEKAAPYYAQAKEAAQLMLAKVRGSDHAYEDALEEAEDDDAQVSAREEVSAPEAPEESESAKSLELD